MTKQVELAYEVHTFRTVDGVELEAHVAFPTGEAGDGTRPALAYFHPGGWRAGSPGFSREVHYLASRGMVAVSFGYRLLPNRRRAPVSRAPRWARLGAARSLVDCIADAQAAVRWLRRRDGVDAARVVAGGYSAGAHLAAAAALVPAVERSNVSCRPNALVLYASVFGARQPEASPLAHVRRKAPPALVMCGVADSLIHQNRAFTKAMSDAGNQCELIEFPGGHKAFSARLDNPVFVDSLAQIDRFLVSLDYLTPVRNVERRIAELDLIAPKPRKKRIAAPQ